MSITVTGVVYCTRKVILTVPAPEIILTAYLLFGLCNCMANFDLYATIRFDPDPNRIVHKSWGSFVPMHHAYFRATVYFQRI